MEKNLINKESNNSDINFIIEKLTIQQLVDFSTDPECDKQLSQEARQELIRRGMDNIQARITIKKSCKSSITDLEKLITNTQRQDNGRETLKSFKGKFLTSVSVLDKLQLEWQKHDLGIRA